MMIMEQEAIQVNKIALTVKEYQGQRVVTLKEIDQVHQRPEGTARKRFNDNKQHFIQGTDFFKITASDFRTAFGGMDERQQTDITLITESGYLMLVKSFTDDLAWDVQRKLVNSYFKVKTQTNYGLPQDYPSALRALADTAEKNLALIAENAQQKQIIAEYSPKASYYDLVLQTPDAIAVSKIAKDYGKSAKWLNQTLHEKGVQFKQGDVWLLYQKYAEMGYTKSKTHTYADNQGGQHSWLHTYWTQKGRLFIYDLLKEDGILPLIEQENQGNEEKNPRVSGAGRI